MFSYLYIDLYAPHDLTSFVLKMKINIERLKHNMIMLSKFSDTTTGVTRLAFTDTYEKGREFVKDLMKKMGLITRIDNIGNLIGRLEGEEDRPAIIIGSHIDTVPNGGMFDGALGVLGGIEVVQTLIDNKYRTKHPIEIIAFIDEEGTSGLGGTFGSRSMMGLVEVNEIIKERLKELNLSINDIKQAYRDPATMKCYLELHIEQGRELYDKKIPIGIVTEIVGIWKYIINVKGKAEHAGTTPIHLRDDALLKSMPIIEKIYVLLQENKDLIGNIGNITVKPGVSNVIPELVEIAFELRSIHKDKVDEFINQLGGIVNFGDKIKLNIITEKPPSTMDKRLQEKIAKACRLLGIKYEYIVSRAGHDAREMAKKIPSAMIFVPSKEGISHSPKEWTDWKYIKLGTQVLLETLMLIDKEN